MGKNYHSYPITVIWLNTADMNHSILKVLHRHLVKGPWLSKIVHVPSFVISSMSFGQCEMTTRIYLVYYFKFSR